MGYRSDFKLTTNKEGQKIIENKVGKWIIGKNKDNIIPCYKVEEDSEQYYTLSGEYLKMYDEFEEIQKLYDCLDEMDKKDIDYIFIRLGEEYEDIEERTNYNKENIRDLYIVRNFIIE